jgi:hypothetical protein
VEDKKQAIQQWRNKLRRNTKQMFKFAREASPVLPVILPDENGRPTSDPVKQLKAAQNAWKQVL